MHARMFAGPDRRHSRLHTLTIGNKKRPTEIRSVTLTVGNKKRPTEIRSVTNTTVIGNIDTASQAAISIALVPLESLLAVCM